MFKIELTLSIMLHNAICFDNTSKNLKIKLSGFYFRSIKFKKKKSAFCI